jgi:hypothetical protein
MGTRSVGPLVAAGALMLAPVAAAQVPIPSPPPLTGGGPRDLPPVGVEDSYGPPEGQDLEQVANNGAGYQRHNVRVRGRLDDLVPGRYLMLTDGAVRVMLITFFDADYREISVLMGLEVEVTGIVRRIPGRQQIRQCHGGSYVESKCDDFLLPQLPDGQLGWPEQSITLIAITDRGKGVPRKETRRLADTGIDAAAAEGKPVRAIGQFRGANLCRDLPAESRRDLADWVLLTSEGPLWVTGRRPSGKGFQLDPAYRPDTARWLEVSGKVLVAGEVSYLKAGKVALIARPEEAAPVPCPP